MWRVRGLSRISLSYNVLPLFSADASIYVSFSPSYAAISAGGGIGIFFDRKHKKRAAELANESTVSSQWKELFERSEKKVDAQSDKIEGLYKTIGNMRSQLDGLASQKAVLTLYKCCKVNCPDREPPFGSQEKTHNKNHEQQ